MAIYAISDLHLSFGTNKPMDIFGTNWTNYEEKIMKNWCDKVNKDDTVIIAGDLSWSMYLKDTLEDFKFLNILPGNKIILKGNHDYWWESLTKMNNFLKENNFEKIYFLYNNFYETEDYLICGTRYWGLDENNEKMFNREIERLKLSIESAREKSSKPIIVVTHYPPDERIINVVKSYNVKKWIYGHIHSNYEQNKVEIPNIDTYLTSCDYLNFDLVKIT